MTIAAKAYCHNTRDYCKIGCSPAYKICELPVPDEKQTEAELSAEAALIKAAKEFVQSFGLKWNDLYESIVLNTYRQALLNAYLLLGEERWIKISDQKPPENISVLLCEGSVTLHKPTGKHKGGRVFIGMYSVNFGEEKNPRFLERYTWLTKEFRECEVNPDYWMHIPKPPVETNGENDGDKSE